MLLTDIDSSLPMTGVPIFTIEMLPFNKGINFLNIASNYFNFYRIDSQWNRFLTFNLGERVSTLYYWVSILYYFIFPTSHRKKIPFNHSSIRFINPLSWEPLFPVAQTVKNLLAMRESCVWSQSQEYPLEKEMATLPSILSWKSHGQRSLVGYSPWGCKELDTTERLTHLNWAPATPWGHQVTVTGQLAWRTSFST